MAAVLAGVCPAVDAATFDDGASAPPRAAGGSLRFAGTGVDGVDRVKIRLRSTTRANVGAGDVTIEFFVRGRRSANDGSGCRSGDAGWITGSVVIDRDVYGPGDRGDFGISVTDGAIAAGVSGRNGGVTICGTRPVLDGAWHHVALTRRASDGRVRLFVDGRPDGSAIGPTGDISYRIGRSTSWPASDPYLVIGAEKHDAGPAYPSFAGWVDEVRLSTVVRYARRFTPPSSPFRRDSDTAALYHLDDRGSTAVDEAGTSPGRIVRSAEGAPFAATSDPW